MTRGRIRLPQRRRALPSRAAGPRARCAARRDARRRPRREHLVRAAWRRSPHEHGIPWIAPRGPERRRHSSRGRGLAPDFLFSFYYRRMLSAGAARRSPRAARSTCTARCCRSIAGARPVNWAVLQRRARDRRHAALHGRQARRRATSSPRRRCRSCRTTRALEVFAQGDRGRRDACSTGSLPGARRTGRRRAAPQDLARGLLLRRPQAGGRPHRLVAARDARSTTWCARSRRLIPAHSPTSAAHRVRVLRTRVLTMPPVPRRRRRLAIDDGAMHRALRRRRHAAYCGPRGRRQARRRRASSQPRQAPATCAVNRWRWRIASDEKGPHPRRQRLHRPPPVAGIIATTDWDVYGMDMQIDRIADSVDEPRFHFFEGDITINKEWIEYHIKKCDVVLPLVAIATPATYVREPLRVFELDFEANLPIVRACVRYGKRIVFPSTSEVYGMCARRASSIRRPRTWCSGRSTSRAGSMPARSSSWTG